MEKLSWTALEYEEKERSQDWFWALGVVVVAGALASMIFANYFFAALIALSGVLLGFFATKKPEEVSFELNSKGLKVRNRLYPYDRIVSFWVQTSYSHTGPEEKELRPTLFIKSERVFMPIIAVPIDDSFAEKIHSVLTEADIPEEKMTEHPSERIMEFFGF